MSREHSPLRVFSERLRDELNSRGANVRRLAPGVPEKLPVMPQHVPITVLDSAIVTARGEAKPTKLERVPVAALFLGETAVLTLTRRHLPRRSINQVTIWAPEMYLHLVSNSHESPVLAKIDYETDPLIIGRKWLVDKHALPQDQQEELAVISRQHLILGNVPESKVEFYVQDFDSANGTTLATFENS